MNRLLISAAVLVLSASLAGAQDMMLQVTADDQDVASGTVTAASVTTTADGWLVIHRTGDDNKPGPVVGHVALKKGENANVVTKLDEPIKAGDKLMLMIHGEDGGMQAGVFEYTLGAKEDGPIRVDGKPVTDVISAK